MHLYGLLADDAAAGEKGFKIARPQQLLPLGVNQMTCGDLWRCLCQPLAQQLSRTCAADNSVRDCLSASGLLVIYYYS